MEDPEMGEGVSVGRKGKASIWSCRGGLLLGDCRKDWDPTYPSWKELRKVEALE